MNILNHDEDSSSSRNVDEIDTPRKRSRLDNSSRRSWSLMDRKTDHEVLQEMGVSLLEPDDLESHNDSTPASSHRCLKRKHNIENVNPRPNSLLSPRKSPKLSPGAGTSRPSPRSCDKAKPLTESNLDVSLTTNTVIDEETPLAQSVSAQYNPALPARKPHTPLGVEENKILTRQPVWEPTAPDSFSVLSDEVMLSVFRWLPKRTLAQAMLLAKRWYRVACDETLWTRLDLGNKTLSKGALGRILARKPLILRLASSEIGAWHGAPAPGPAPEPSRVQYLDLSMASVDVATLNHLLSACPSLRKLSLESVQINDETCEIISKCTSLETLNLTMASGVSSRGVADLMRCSALQSLNLSWCDLQEDALEVVVSEAPPGLQRLNLGGARLMTDEMLSSLAGRCPRLCELDVSDCGRLGAGAVPALLALRRLEHLALSRAYLLPQASLAQLSSMPSLQYLEAWGMLGAPALAALRRALPSVQLNQFMFSAIARPTVGTRRTSIWGLRTRD